VPDASYHISLEAFIFFPVIDPAVNRLWQISVFRYVAGLVYHGFTTYNGCAFRHL